ncbi:MAG: DEAD/DEAH box helicase, partial [Verrucomicrobiota bacterium]
MELTEKLLVSLGGWDAMKRARAIKASGAVREASYSPPMLTGRIAEGGKEFYCGLRLRNPVDIENLCPCADSRRRGMICAHSMAVGLEVLSPTPTKKSTPAATAHAAVSETQTTSEIPKVRLALEGSLRHLEAEISFEYPNPGKQNHHAEALALAPLARCGFEDDKGRAVLRGEDAIVRFFASEMPRLQREWTVVEGERFQHVTRDIVRFEPRFAIKERGDGWLDFHVHFTAGREAVLSDQDLQRLLRSGKPQLRLADGRLAIPDADLASDLEEVLRDCAPSIERGGYRIDPAQRGYLQNSIAEWTGQPANESASSVSEKQLGPLREKLRPYQIDGALWLLRRAKDATAGLLADEMGLGKTIQTLALFESHPGPHLVVCPSSLVWNWLREAERFTPSLKTLALHGSDRDALFERIPSSDLVITSYALLRRDLEKLKPFAFSTAVLDEAQHIKNPDSQNAKAARALQA